jgi:hypothetical protein
MRFLEELVHVLEHPGGRSADQQVLMPGRVPPGKERARALETVVALPQEAEGAR